MEPKALNGVEEEGPAVSARPSVDGVESGTGPTVGDRTKGQEILKYLFNQGTQRPDGASEEPVGWLEEPAVHDGNSVVGVDDFLDCVSKKTSSRELTLTIKGKGLTDENLKAGLSPNLKHLLQKQARELRPDMDWCYLTIDASENNFGAEGMAALGSFLADLRKPVQGGPALQVRELRLYRNKLGDDGAAKVAEILLSQTQPLYELHLSHNRIGCRGAAAILLALGSSGVYPFQRSANSVGACWVRLENNDVPDPEHLISELACCGSVRVEESWRRHDGWNPDRARQWPLAERAQAPHAVLHLFARQRVTEIKWEGNGRWARRGQGSKGPAAVAVKEAFALIAAWHEQNQEAVARVFRPSGDAPASMPLPTAPSPALLPAPALLPVNLPPLAQGSSGPWDMTAEAAYSSNARDSHRPSFSTSDKAVSDQLAAAFVIVESLETCGDDDVVERWRTYLEEKASCGADPVAAASRILDTIRRLLKQGYACPAAAAPPLQRHRVSSPFMTVSPREPALPQKGLAPLSIQAQGRTGNSAATRKEPSQGSTSATALEDARAMESKMLGLLNTLKQDTWPLTDSSFSATPPMRPMADPFLVSGR